MCALTGERYSDTEKKRQIQGQGIFLRCVKNVVFRNVKLYGQQGERMDADDTVTGFEWK